MIQKIYNLSPIWFQNIMISIFGIGWYYRRFGGVFKSEYAKALNRDKYSYNDWHCYHTELLRKLLIHSFKTVPFYKQMFEALNIGEVELKEFEIDDLIKLPFLDKRQFKENCKSKLLSNRLEIFGKYLSSSGSTGTPTYTRYSYKMHQTYFAICEARINNWAGINYKMPRGSIGGRRVVPDGVSNGPFFRYNYVEKQTYFSAYHISKENCWNYVKGLIDNKVTYMSGYASGNYVLAKFIKENGIKVPKLKAVLTSSEKLTLEMRDLFYEVYGCKTFDSYNGVECCNLISECEHGKLHIVPDVGIVEVINEKGEKCMPGEIGEIISTGLLNFDQPLIRYKIGDYVKVSIDQNCQCGRQMIVIDEIIGRIEDYIVGPDGRTMSRFHSVFIDIDQIIEGQIIQHKINEIEVLISTTMELSSNQIQLIINRIKSQLGSVYVYVNYIEYIPRTSNGKFKSVISHLKNKNK